MGRNIGPQCRICRRLGVKLFLKGKRCFSPSCPIERKGAIAPGIHGRRFSRPSPYKKQLSEKQKLKASYGVSERQMKNYFKKARRSGRETDLTLMQMLESRLDNVIFRLGLVPNRRTARQLVGHGKVMVDGQRVTIPSFSVKPGQVLTIKEKASRIPQVKDAYSEKITPPPWLKRKALVGKMVRWPKREELDTQVNMRSIIEFYSR